MSKGKITVKYLQQYIKSKDCHPDFVNEYFLKLTEELGELSRFIRTNKRAQNENDICGTIEEELWDVMYYAIAIANCYNIDLEKIIPVKERMINEKYGNGIEFRPE